MNAVSLAVENLYPDAGSVIELGGQDAKIIIWFTDPVTGVKRKIPSMSDKCAGGTGAVIDKINAKLQLSGESLQALEYFGTKLHPVAGKCGVFAETDIVNFQQMGREKREIMAGLAKVLPKNIWLYVVAEPNLGKFGTNFIFQGGTQHNLAAVKSQYDFVKSKVPNSTVRVHQFTGESGAIGAALEAIRVVAERDSTFIGLKSAETLEFTATRDESTRCSFGKNKCLRTYIDTTSAEGANNRFIIATCEKGIVEKMEDMKLIKGRLEEVMKANPNFVEKASVQAFRSFSPPRVSRLELVEAS